MFMNNLSVLIFGCDKHIEVAQRSYLLIRKLNPFLLDYITFVTDKSITLKKDFFPHVLVVESSNFSERILKALETVKTPYVMHLLDDDFILEKLNEINIDHLVEFLDSNKIHYCKLLGNPKGRKIYKPRFKTQAGSVRRIKQKLMYAVSLQPSMWETNMLKKVSKLGAAKGPTAWDAEICCYKVQLELSDNLLVFNKNYIHSYNVVLKGKLFPKTNKILEKEGIPPLEMPTLSKTETLIFKLRTNVISKLPFRNFWKKIGHLFGKKFYSDEVDNL